MSTSFDGVGKVLSVATATVARTDTAAKNLFTLPKGAIPLFIFLFGPQSNAVTTATINIGRTGTPNYYVAAQDVKTNNLSIPQANLTQMGNPLAADTVI